MVVEPASANDALDELLFFLGAREVVEFVELAEDPEEESEVTEPLSVILEAEEPEPEIEPVPELSTEPAVEPLPELIPELLAELLAEPEVEADSKSFREELEALVAEGSGTRGVNLVDIPESEPASEVLSGPETTASCVVLDSVAFTSRRRRAPYWWF